MALPGALEQQQLEAAARPGVGCDDEARIDLPLRHGQLVEGCSGLVDLRPTGVESASMHQDASLGLACVCTMQALDSMDSSISMRAVIGQCWVCSGVLQEGAFWLRGSHRAAAGHPKGQR